jgi:hypothetical protein
MIVVVGFFFWYYDFQKNSARVIRYFEECGDPKKYARIGALMWYESLLLPFLFVGILVLIQQLTGWPPRP